MNSERLELAEHFDQLDDEELLSQYASGTLTETATAIAAEEIRRRQLQLPAVSEPQAPEAGEYAGDYETVARFLNPVNAHLVCSCLQAAGLPAIVADAQLVQTNSLWAPALGGARVLVPARYVADAKEVIAAFNSGALALRDDDEPT